jgi:hypothetical protein
MGSRLGSPNKKTLRLQELADKYGVDPVEAMFIIMHDLSKTVNNEANKPRSRRSKQYLDAERMLIDVAKECAPYVHSRRAAVTTVDETPRLTVIRAPDQAGTTAAWLAKYGPRHDSSINDRPVIPFAKNLGDPLSIADEIGLNDVNEIVNEAKKQTDGQAPESDLEKLRRGKIW